MSLNGGLSLGFVFTARDVTGPAMRSVQRNFNKLDRGTNRTTKRMNRLQGSVGGVAMASGAAAGSIAALGGAMKSALDAGRFEQELIRANSIVSGTAQTMEQIRNNVMQNAMETQFTPQETLSAFKEIATRGFNARQSMESLASALDLATVGGIKVEQSAALMASSLRVFKKDASDAEHVTNSLAKAAFTSGISITELDIAVSNAARGAQLANQSMQATLSSIGLIKNQGGFASTAGTQFSILTEKLAQHREKVKTLFNVDVASEDGTFRDAQVVTFELMEQAIAKYSNEAERAGVLKQLFGRGAKAATAIHGQLKKGVEGQDGVIRFGLEAIRYRNEQILNSKGFLARAKEELLDTFAGQADLLKGILGGLAIELGQSMGEVLKPLVTRLISVGKTVLKFFKDMSPETKKILSTVTLLGLGLTAVVTTIGALAATIGYVAPFITAGLSALGTALPWILGAAAAVGVLAAGFYALKKAYDTNLGGFANTIRDKFNKVRMAFDGVIQLITTGKITGRTAKDLKDPNNAPVLRFLNLVVKWGFRAKAFVEAFVARVKQQWKTLEPSFRRLSGAIFKVTSKIDELVQKFTDGTPGVKNFASKGILGADIALGIFGTTVDIVSGYLETWVGWITGVEEAFTSLSLGDLTEEASELGAEINKFLIAIGEDPGDGSLLSTVGRVLGWIAGAGLAALKTVSVVLLRMVRYGVGLVRGIVEFNDWIESIFDGRMRARIDAWWDGLVQDIQNTWEKKFRWLMGKLDDALMSAVELGRLVPERLQTEGFASALDSAEAGVMRRRGERASEDQAYRDSIQTEGLISSSSLKAIQDYQDIMKQTTAASDGSPSPVSEGMTALSEAVRSGMEIALSQKFPDKKKGEEKPTKVETTVKLDGTILGRAMYAIGARDQALSFGGDQQDEDE